MTKKIERLEDLQTNPKNHNKGSERGVYAIEESIRRLGAGRSGLCDRNGKMIAGNHSLEAIAQLGIPVKVVPTDGNEWVIVQRTDLNLDEDNKAVELSYADNLTTKLNFEIETEQLLADLENVDLSYLYTDAEIQALIDEINQNPEESEKEKQERDRPIDESEVESRVKRGEVWQIGHHLILCGDCRNADDVSKLIQDREINVAFTSPPYASQRKYDEESEFKPIAPDEYVQWFAPVQSNIKRHLSPDGGFFLNIKEHCDEGQRHLYVKDLAIAHVRQWHWLLVDEFCWQRPGMPMKQPNRFKNSWEPVFHFAMNRSIKFRPENVAEVKDTAWKADGGVNHKEHRHGEKADSGEYFTGKVWPSNVIEVSGVEQGISHTAMFPVGLPEFFIKAFSDRGDVIYDPCCGSGTTLVASHNQGRIGLGMEISEKYSDLILTRLERVVGETAVRIEE